MSKTVWIIHQYESTLEAGNASRHFYMARELAKLGYKVYVIAANNHHLLRNPIAQTEPLIFDNSHNFTFVWINMSAYTNAHSKQRAINWFLFSWRIQRLAKLIPDKPDAILASSPSPVAFLGAERLAKKLNARLLFEVRDIWPLTLIELGGYSPKHPFIRFMQWVEDRAYRKSDRVISNLKNSVEHMQQRGMDPDKFVWIPNGFSLKEVGLEVPLNSSAQNRLPQDKFIIGYTGTIGVANALDTFIDAADLLRGNTEIAFVIVGNGKEKEHLESIVKEKRLTNVTFIEAIPKVEIQAMLSRFDVCYIGLTKDNLFKYGVSPNKLFDYFYSGKPIIYSIDSGKYHPVLDANAGLEITPMDSKALAQAILQLYQVPENERKQLGENGRKVALEQYEYGMLAKKLETVLFGE